MGDTRRETFELLVETYTSTYPGHMEVEETYVLPVAMDYLSAVDWRELEAAFSRQRGALTESSALYQRIVARATIS
jgi:hemerythrin-like domain-containing protein